MRLKIAASLALAFCLALPFARGDDDDDDRGRVPFNPFAVAKVGDWSLFDMTWTGNDIPARHGWLLLKVTKLENDRDVTLTAEQKINDNKTSCEYVFSSKEDPPLEKLARVFSGVQFPSKVLDYKKRGDGFPVDGRTFPGWKLTFRSENDNDANGKYVMFFSKDVKASGTVICRYDGKDGSKVEARVKGIGSKDGGTEWGQAPEGGSPSSDSKPQAPRESGEQPMTPGGDDEGGK